ncbi:MAG TPA: hypothetical protein VLS88_19090 [Polyangiales bacterium]|nr:hypothetical protein [Polyangiales bacterium]
MIRIVMLAAVLLATVSCKKTFQPQTAEVVDPGPPDRVLPTIRVLDAGMTPRVPLRYRIPPGQTELLYLEIVRAQAMRSGNRGAQGGIPPVQLEVKIGPEQPTLNGLIRHPVQITQVRLSRAAEQMSAAQREQMESTLAPLLQVQGWSEMDIQGRVRRSEFRGLEDVPPDLRAMLGNIRTSLLTIPFPDEPVGARARWEVERKIQISGAWIDQIVTYHVEQIDGQNVVLQVTARQSADPQAISGGRLEAYQTSVIGSSVVRLDHFAAFSEAEATSKMRIATRTQSGSELVQVDTKTALRLYPADATKEFDPKPPEEEAPDPEDVKVITDPGKQRLKW